MANEIDRKLMPGFLQKSFAISLGCMHKSVEMVKDPGKALADIMTEAKTLVTPPSDAGDGIGPKAKALAAVWVEKSMNMMEECRVAGEKFTGAQ